MTRKKVKLVWIVNDTARKASLKKRRLGLLKKVSELTILCGVSAFCIIYSPDDNDPTFWPSRPVVQQLIMRYDGLPEMERCKKMTNQEGYLKERIGKVQEQKRKNIRRNKDMEIGWMMRLAHQGKGLDGFDLIQLHTFAWLIEDRLKDMRKRVDYFQQVPPLPPDVFPPAPGENPATAAGGEGGNAADAGNSDGDGRNNMNPTEALSWDQWFLDIINNSENNIAGSSGGTRGSDHGMPHGYGPVGGIDLGFQYPRNVGMGLLAPPPPPPPPPHPNMGGNPYMLPVLPSPHGINIGGSSAGGHPHGMGLPPFHSHGNFAGAGGNPFGLGLQPFPPHANIAGPSSAAGAGNPLFLGLPPLYPPGPDGSNTGGNLWGLPGTNFGGNASEANAADGSDMGFPGFFTFGSSASDDSELPHDLTRNWPDN